MSFDATNNDRSQSEERIAALSLGERLVHKTDIVYREYYPNALIHCKSRKFARQ